MKGKDDDVILAISVSKDFLQSPLRSPAVTGGRQKLVLYDVIGVTLTQLRQILFNVAHSVIKLVICRFR